MVAINGRLCRRGQSQSIGAVTVGPRPVGPRPLRPRPVGPRRVRARPVGPRREHHGARGRRPGCADLRRPAQGLGQDSDGDGRVTHEDFRRAPVAAVAVDMALQGSMSPSRPIHPLANQQSFGSVATQVGPPPPGYAEPMAAGRFGPPPRPGQAPVLPGRAGVAGSGALPLGTPLGSFAPPGVAPVGPVPHAAGLLVAPPPLGGVASTPHPAGLRR
ncbi:unnamed protein product [Prorocentrum cordatum]|uniref:EF-hand domain-containing protein n=1 Tax=Prorocentrum cordatum TaxID=2364126 RepID=A0ABN9XNL1_9DINO|nr:unnamed protein product [Polarella glacialis]